MAKLTMTDLPKDVAISQDEMNRVHGGAVDCFMKIDGIPGEGADPLPRLAVDKSTPKLAESVV